MIKIPKKKSEKKQKDLVVRSSKLSINQANFGKKDHLKIFLQEYLRVAKFFIDILWEMKHPPSLPPKEITDLMQNSWFTARMIQCCAKQASGIVRGTLKKHKQRVWRMKKLQKTHGDVKRLQSYVDKHPPTKPDINRISPELDSRFITIDLNNETSFDGWMTIQTIGKYEGKKMILVLPFKRTIHFNQQDGAMGKGCRISLNYVTFSFKQKIAKKEQGETVGIDIGQTDCWYCSNGEKSGQDRDGWDLNKISDKLARRKKGSKNFRKAQTHRKNHINWSLNQLDIDNIKQINVEDLKNVRFKKRNRRKLTHWTYTEIADKLERLTEEAGVLLIRIDPAYTSQRCSVCGWTRESNRSGKWFCCTNPFCPEVGTKVDADLNASMNLEVYLPSMKGKRWEKLNREGFFWEISSVQESIVPGVRES